MREAAKPALEKLDELGIKYYYYEHPLAKTMEDCEGIGADVGAKHFKNIYACDHTETNFFIIIIRADKKFRTSEVSRKLGVSRLSFCTDEMLEENLGVSVHRLDDPTHSVVKGAAAALKNPELLKNVDYQMRSIKELAVE